MSSPRPNPPQLLWYAFGGRLPERYREWVLADLTTRGWLWRYGVRAFVRLAPVAALVAWVLWLVSGEPLVAAMSVSLGLIVGVYFSLSYAIEKADSRLVRYGYPPNHASAVRRADRERLRQEESARYAARWRHAP
ncbi:DUF5313 family protein [Actinoalloteichus spitiensis]|uniref:DUF5313 family protein n=1 Tax=Actinoalloteichus spitiensis TaxID=252394 RepID=UPI00037BACD7|nr:DUF5313 family protein [Actinoalloteichus spitiensis]